MIKIGLLGAGYLGKIHIKCLKAIPEFDFVGFYDVDSCTRKKVSEELNVKAFESLDELLDEVEAVDIVTTTINHFQCAEIAIKKGKHIFVEKPVVANNEEADALLQLSKETNVKIQVGHIERFNPAYLSVEPLIKGPIFLEAHRYAPYNVRGTDVPVVLDLMIHDIDILLHIVNSKITHLSACGVPVISKTPDIANVRIEFENGAAANLTASRLSMKKMRKCRIFQPNKYIIIDYLDQISEVVSIDDNPDFNDPFALLIHDADGYESPRQLKFIKPKITKNNAIQSELFAFYKSIAEDSPTAVSLEDGVAALKLAVEINKLVENSFKKFYNH